MLIRRALTLLGLFALITPPVRAQRVSIDTLDVVSAQPGVEAQLRLINLGAGVTVMTGGRPLPMKADTLYITTPVRLVLPQGDSFSLAVSTATPEPGVQTVITSRDNALPEHRLFATTFYSPYTFRRDSTGADLKMTATRMQGTAVQRAP